MSARQPFVPGALGSSSRPESRAAHANSVTNSAPASTSLHFVADPSNPLNGGSTATNTQKDHNENVENRPLNIGSLTKTNRTQNPISRRQSVQAVNHPTRPTTSDPHSSRAPVHNHRPGTSDPHSKTKSNAAPNHRLQAHSAAKSYNIVVPTPLQARSTPSLFSNTSSSFSSSFKTPALPAGSRLSPDAHEFRTPTNDPMHSQMTNLHPPSPDQSREEPVSDNSTFRLKVLPSQPGPHRLVFGAPVVTDLSEEDEIYEIPDAEVPAKNKRRRSAVDEDENDEHAQMQSYRAAKRFKGQQVNDENAYPRSSNDANEMYRRSSSPHEAQEYPPQQPRHAASRLGNLAPSVSGHRLPPQYSNSAPSPESSHRSSEMDRLLHILKADQLDLACDAKIEKYTSSVEKWKACSREEWMAGAEELTGRYNKIFDFVKSHMAEKVQLFATCDGRLQQQTEVLNDREILLAGVKDVLVAESGNVLK
ncbi:hypothetical protein C8R44DRAFT_729383 [Mycena epipterygia]|nr:hypothetical protein C8R44DRAFT_729383 [Mycena epipterygia]